MAKISQQLRQEEIVSKIRLGMTPDDIAPQYGLTPDYVRILCRDRGVEFQLKKRKTGMTLTDTLDWVISQCVRTESGCLLWFGCMNPDGYAMIRFGDKSIAVHRKICERHFKRKMVDGECCCHSCDQRNCLEASHMWIGSHQQNMADREAKGRNKIMRGESHGNAKLNDTLVRQMRDLVWSGRFTRKDVAVLFGVCTKSAVERICNRKTWTHVN